MSNFNFLWMILNVGIRSTTVNIFKFLKRFEFVFSLWAWIHFNFRSDQLAVFIHHNDHLMLPNIYNRVQSFGRIFYLLYDQSVMDDPFLTWNERYRAVNLMFLCIVLYCPFHTLFGSRIKIIFTLDWTCQNTPWPFRWYRFQIHQIASCACYILYLSK